MECKKRGTNRERQVSVAGCHTAVILNADIDILSGWNVFQCRFPAVNPDPVFISLLVCREKEITAKGMAILNCRDRG
jgi:hypothetical protein